MKKTLTLICALCLCSSAAFAFRTGGTPVTGKQEAGADNAQKTASTYNKGGSGVQNSLDNRNLSPVRLNNTISASGGGSAGSAYTAPVDYSATGVFFMPATAWASYCPANYSSGARQPVSSFKSVSGTVPACNSGALPFTCGVRSSVCKDTVNYTIVEKCQADISNGSFGTVINVPYHKAGDSRDPENLTFIQVKGRYYAHPSSYAPVKSNELKTCLGKADARVTGDTVNDTYYVRCCGGGVSPLTAAQ